MEKNFAKVSVVGAGMQSNPGVASRMFEALFEANVNIHMISTSEIKDQRDHRRGRCRQGRGGHSRRVHSLNLFLI